MELNKELGKWLLDISKYLITAMLLTTAFGDMSNPWIVVSVIFSAALTFLVRLSLAEEKHSKHQ